MDRKRDWSKWQNEKPKFSKPDFMAGGNLVLCCSEAIVKYCQNISKMVLMASNRDDDDDEDDDLKFCVLPIASHPAGCGNYCFDL